MSETMHDELLISLAGYVPQFALSIACVHSKADLAESAARKHRAAYTPYAPDVALSQSARYDCVLIGENAEGILARVHILTATPCKKRTSAKRGATIFCGTILPPQGHRSFWEESSIYFPLSSCRYMLGEGRCIWNL